MYTPEARTESGFQRMKCLVFLIEEKEQKKLSRPDCEHQVNAGRDWPSVSSVSRPRPPAANHLLLSQIRRQQNLLSAKTQIRIRSDALTKVAPGRRPSPRRPSQEPRSASDTSERLVGPIPAQESYAQSRSGLLQSADNREVVGPMLLWPKPVCQALGQSITGCPGYLMKPEGEPEGQVLSLDHRYVS
jgi:hypothetical protein